MSTLLFLGSLAYLGWILFISARMTIPAWMHRFFEHQRQIKPHLDQQGQEVSAVGLLQNLLILLSVVALYFVFDGLGFGLSVMVDSGVWFLIVIFLAIAVAWIVGRNLAHHWGMYKTVKNRQEAEQTLKTAYGAKDWATQDELAARLNPKNGKDWQDEGIHLGDAWHWNEKGHMLTVGGSGQGKGVSLILPALLSNGFVRGAGVSVVCLDPKGENAAVAAPFLKRAGYEVHIINPTGIAEIADLGNSRWNPFDMIDPANNNASKMYDVLANALHIDDSRTGSSAFFNDRCRQYISLYLSYAQHTGNANWDTVYKWLTSAGERRSTLLASMATDETFDGADMAAAISDRLTSNAAETEENIYGTVEKAVNILKDKSLRASLAGSDFDMREIAKKPTAIFVCIPFEELEYYSPWVRMFFNFLLRTLTRHYDVNRKVLILLDEFAQLSYMDEVVKSATVLRGYNVTLWTIVQGLGQLQDIYGEKWETSFVSSAIIKHWLSAGADNTTADYIAKRMPQALHFIGNNADGSPREREKPLMNTSEIIGFDEIICEISGLNVPAKLPKKPYWELPFSKGNASPNPFY